MKRRAHCVFPISLSSRAIHTWRAALMTFVLASVQSTTSPAQEDNGKNSKTEEKPNIVIIIADDMAWDDCTAYGHKTIHTPHLHKLADDGMLFENAFLTTSSCSPSRASIITGLYPHNTGADELHWPLQADQITFVEKLRKAGYWTGAAGKWHLGNAVRNRFDTVMEVDTSGFQLPSGKEGEAGKFKETLVGEAQSGCADWLPLMKKVPAGKPFFLWLAALDPHRPYHNMILGTGHESPPNRATDFAGHTTEDITVAPYHPDTVEVRNDYRAYYDEIARLDQYIGRVMDQLEKMKASENTMLLFFSDNGRPFPRDKTTLYDSGIKTPWIVRWPGKVKAGTVCKRLVSSVDIAPTALEIAGIDAPANFEGRSFLSLLSEPDRKMRDFVFAEKNWHDFEDHSRAVRNERYKYIRNNYNDLPLTPPADALRSPTYTTMLSLREAGKLLPHQLACFIQPRPREELYDTKTDPHELNNLTKDEQSASVLAKMREALADWQRRTGDKAPAFRTADEFDRVTGKPTAARVRPRRSKKQMVQAGLTAP